MIPTTKFVLSDGLWRPMSFASLNKIDRILLLAPVIEAGVSRAADQVHLELEVGPPLPNTCPRSPNHSGTVSVLSSMQVLPISAILYGPDLDAIFVS